MQVAEEGGLGDVQGGVYGTSCRLRRSETMRRPRQALRIELPGGYGWDELPGVRAGIRVCSSSIQWWIGSGGG